MTSEPTQKVLAALERAGKTVRPSGPGYMAQCPAHDDRTPSLSIKTGDDGRALLHCHADAACSVENIVAAIGLSGRDLFPRTNGPSGSAKRREAKRKPPRTYPTPDAAAEALARQTAGEWVGDWMYPDADGRERLTVLRFDLAGGDKTYRPIHPSGDGWAIGDPPGDEPLPLYRLPEPADAKRVYVCEGEKAADAARSIGLTATTSAHGAESPHKTDWRPLAGKDVVILPDNDEAGRSYAAWIARHLLKLDAATTVRVVELPDLPDRGDIHDWVANQDGAEGLAEQVQAFAEAAPVLRPEAVGVAQPLTFRPFPVDALPPLVRQYVTRAAEAVGCDPSFIAVPLLTAAAAAIGNTRRIRLKAGWHEPAILWSAIVADSGSAKSPALDFALRPVHELSRECFREHEQAMQRFEQAKLEYERDLVDWRKGASGYEDPPEKPSEPRPERLICSDTTIEALATLLQENWRGLLLARDELAGWLGSFDRYSSGKGGDAAHWLEMHGARPMVVDRKTGNPPTLHVPRAAVCVTGSIQPETLRNVLGREHFGDGLAARVLLTMPPRKPKRWTEAEVSDELAETLRRIFENLYALEPGNGEDGDPLPLAVPLSGEARQVFIDFYNAHAEEQAELSGDLSAAWAKLEGYAARLALVVHFLRWAVSDESLADAERIDAESITAGINLSQWFGNETRRVYAMLSNADAEHETAELVNLIQSKAGRVTVRQLMQASRRYRGKADDAEAVLQGLVDDGRGDWITESPRRTGGRPAKIFQLRSGNGNTTPQNLA